MRKIAGLLLIASLTQLACVRISQSSASRSPQSSDTAKTSQYPNLKLQAIQLSEATVRGDQETVEKLTYQKLIDEWGGSEGFREALVETLQEIEAKALKIESISVGEPQDFLEFEQRIYVIVPNKMKVRGPIGLVIADAYLIGISEDKGMNWTFVGSDVAADKELLTELFPGVADKLRIPEFKRPVLQKDAD